MDTFETALSEIIQKKTQEINKTIEERERIKKDLRDGGEPEPSH